MSVAYEHETADEAMARTTAAFLRRLAAHLDTPDDGLVLFEQVSAHQCVKLAGEWWWVRGRKVEHDLLDQPHRFLVVGDRDNPDWDYEVGDGERFLVSEPF